MRQAFPFEAMWRLRESSYELIEVQLDYRGAPKFVLNVGKVPQSGIRLPWAELSPEEVVVSDLPNAYRLYAGSWLPRWFSAASIFGDHDERRAVTHAVARLPQVFEWLRSDRRGPDMKRYTYPVQGS